MSSTATEPGSLHGLNRLQKIARGENTDLARYTGFRKAEEDTLVDFVLVRESNCVVSPSYCVPSNNKDGDYISDHRLVIVDLEVS